MSEPIAVLADAAIRHLRMPFSLDEGAELREAPVDGFDAAAQHRAADEMADRVVRTTAAEGADG